MPAGPGGGKRPADSIGMPVMAGKIAPEGSTGGIEDNRKPGRVKSGKAGAQARAGNPGAEKRSGIARKAASARRG